MMNPEKIYTDVKEISLEYVQSKLKEMNCSSNIIEKETVHKKFGKNVFIRDVKQVGSSEEFDEIIAVYNIPSDHPFFFEHEKDHIPGLMLIEAGRQTGTATSHLVYNVGRDQVFILEDMQVKFFNLANLESTLYSFNYIKDKVYKRGNIISLVAEGYIYQEDKKIVYMKSKWRIINPLIYERLKKK